MMAWMERSGCQHPERHDAQDAPVERSRGARIAKRAKEAQERSDPEDEHGQVEALLDRPPGDFTRYLKEQKVRFAEIIKKNNIRID